MAGKIIKIIESYFDSSALQAEIALCFREFSALYNAGIPFTRALEVVSNQTENPRLRDALRGAYKSVQSGKTIAHSLGAYPRVFPEIYTKMVEIGETSGELEIMLTRISQHAEKGRETKMKLRAALVYPVFVFVFVLCLGLLIIGPAFVFRGIFDFLQELDVALLLTTRILIGASSLFRSPLFLFLMILMAAGGIVIIKFLWSKIYWRRRIQGVLLLIPGVGKSLQASDVTAFSRTLAVVYETGMPLIEGLKLAKKSCSLVVLQNKVDEVREKITEGSSLQESLKETNFFPPTLLHLLEAGEQTGNVGIMLERSAALGEENLNQALDTAMALLQPVVLLIIGIIVGFFVIGTMTPMLKMIEGLG